MRKLMKWTLLAFLGVIALGVIGSMLSPTDRREPVAVAPSTAPAAPVDAPATPSGPAPGVTLANYLRLETGMSYPDAVAILGETGTEMSRSDLANITTVMYQWTGSGLGNMNAMFQNGKLVSKAQFGLK